MIPKVSRFSDRVSNNHQLKCYQALIDIMDAENGYLTENRSGHKVTGEKFVYQSIRTAAGAEAGFSIFDGSLNGKALYGFHSWYFASSGTEGSEAGWGGRGGRGGCPGYGGEIDIQLNSGISNVLGGSGKSPRNSGQPALITVEKSDGSPGKVAPAGKQGQPGRPGRKGTDYACVHPFETIHGRTFYKGALIKRLHESKTEPSPYCGWAKSKIHFENSLREITRLKSEHKRSELKARAPLKTTQKQKSIIKSNTQNQFQAHCRRYFLNLDKSSSTGLMINQKQHLFQSSPIHNALQTLQIATRICDFNPRDPVPPPRRKRIKEGSMKTLSESSRRKSIKPFTPPVQGPLLDLACLLEQTNSDVDTRTHKNLQELSKTIKKVVHSSDDPNSLSIETCERILCSIMRHDENIGNHNDYEIPTEIQDKPNSSIGIIHRIKINLTQNLRSQLLLSLHTQMQELPEVSIGKIRKFDPNFCLAFIKNCGQLENNYQSANLHAAIGQDIERYLIAEMTELKENSSTTTSLTLSSHFFTVFKTTIFEKDVTSFSSFMQYLNRWTKKHVKKLSKCTEVPNHDEDNDPWPKSRNERSVPPELTGIGALEYRFFEDYFDQEAVGLEHHQKLKTILFLKINKWLQKSEVLTEYAQRLSKGPLADWDFDILATIYGVHLRIYKAADASSTIPNNPRPQLQLRYAAEPLVNCATIQNQTIEPNLPSHPRIVRIIETEENTFAPLATASSIGHQQAQIYLEILNDTSRPEFFDEFDLAERQQAVQECFRNRRFVFTLSKFCSQPSSDLDQLTQNLSSLLPDTPKIVKLALMTSSRFDNRFLTALVERMTWQGNTSLTNNPCPFVELGLAILESDEVDVLHLEWIVTSLPQREWILEFMFIQLQQYLRNCINRPLSQFHLRQWKENLSTLDPIGVVLLAEKVADYFHERRSSSDDTFYQQVQLLNNIEHISIIIAEIALTPEDIYNELVDLRLEDWVKKLINIKIRKTFVLLNPEWIEDENNQDYKKCLYYASSLYNEHPNFIDNCLRTLRSVKKAHPRTQIDTTRLVEIFSNYYHGRWSVFNNDCEIDFQQFDSFQFFYTVLSHQNDSKITRGERSRDEILKFISNDKNTTLRQMDIQRLRLELKEEPKSGFGFLDPDVPIKEAIGKWAQKVRSVENKPGVEEMLFCLNSGVFQCKRFHFRDTQKVTLVALLQEERRNVLAQVATGEGKSLIVVAWAIIKVLLGGRCDIVTSSPILAERDVDENKDIFDLFHVTVGHNSRQVVSKFISPIFIHTYLDPCFLQLRHRSKKICIQARCSLRGCRKLPA